MIPKVIHYCWFGGNPKSNLIKACIASWKRYCPDWVIMEWNEENYNVRKIDYMSEAYDAKKWAFVSDVARLDIVLQHGGVYLDTDVELLAPIDPLCESRAFFAFESERNVNSGLGFGAEQGHCTVKGMLNSYRDRHFIVNGKADLRPCPRFNTEELLKINPTIKRDGADQNVDGTAILSCGTYSKYAIHHGAASWGDTPKTEIQPLRQYKDTTLKRVLRNPACFSFVERHLGKRGLNVYTFIAYDLMEYGFVYFVKRFINKCLL